MKDLDKENNQISNNENEILLHKIKIFFQKLNYPIDHEELMKLDSDDLINTVCMISPFSVEEKQKLIETREIGHKIKLLDEIINFNLIEYQENKTIQ